MPNTFTMRQPLGSLLLQPASAPWWIAAVLAALMLWGFVQLLDESVQRGEALRATQRQESAEQLARWREATPAAEVIPVVLPALTRVRMPVRMAPRYAPRAIEAAPADSSSPERMVQVAGEAGEAEVVPAFHHAAVARDGEHPMMGQRVAWGR